MRVLVVEDDDDLRFAVSAALRGDGLAVDAVADLPAADEALFVTDYDCAVFDRMLPAGDSLDYLRELRLAGRTVPVLFLTARDQVEDRVAGFAAGGDDYLVKPFALPELTARVRSLCRRAGTVRPPVHRVADLEVDTARRQVRRDGVLLSLTGKEFAVLETLAARADLAVSRGELVEKCWDELTEPNSNVVDVLMSQLRRKLGEPALIHTVRGLGYRLAATDGTEG
ncbi:response regulator transcription factor [Kitasatospora viridis]|uniref:response regulator transcription factor n=1 Tax=Kitasatospora viridis TaxID=281105 RepID=UPI0011A1F9B3|nr:response regulator transcription factor [Kitasatospora viridis]